MSKIICLIVIILTCKVCSGQNLVPNPSFEDTVQCPLGAGGIAYAQEWYRARGSADYFNPCANNGYVNGVPNNFTGTQFPFDGNSYAGLVTYGLNSYQGFREYMGIQLLQSLTIGIEYYVSGYISRRDTMHGPDTLRCATNKFGFRFSTIPYDTFPYASSNNYSHVHSDSIIISTSNWTNISGSFIADSNYQYLIIGNFYDDVNTDTAQCFGGFAYYLLDMVCVSVDSLTCNSSVGINLINNITELNLFPNPFSDELHITTKRNDLIKVNIFDITARKVLQHYFTNSALINTEQLTKGIYLYELSNKNGVIKNGMLIKN